MFRSPEFSAEQILNALDLAADDILSGKPEYYMTVSIPPAERASDPITATFDHEQFWEDIAVRTNKFPIHGTFPCLASR